MGNGLRVVGDALTGLVPYIPMTLYFLIVPSVLSLILGTIICAIRVGRKNILYHVVSVMVSFFRGTPGLVQLYLVLYGLPKLLQIVNVDINRWSPGTFFVIATSLNLASFVSEALRGAYLAMDRGQMEAGYSIGYSRWQCLFYVIAPQTLQTALPNLKNLEIDLLKGTALAYTIGAVEVMGYANTLIALKSGVGRMWILLAAAIIYFLINTVLELFFNLLTRHYSRYERSPS